MIGQGNYLKEVVNLFEYHQEITSKLNLVKNLIKHYNHNVSPPFNITPLVFIINFDHKNWQKEISLFLEFYNKNKLNKNSKFFLNLNFNK
jgi:hypothetical protein